VALWGADGSHLALGALRRGPHQPRPARLPRGPGSRSPRLVERCGSKDDLKTEASAALRRLQQLLALVRASFADPDLRYITGRRQYRSGSARYEQPRERIVTLDTIE
jgi:hypothetical protein